MMKFTRCLALVLLAALPLSAQSFGYVTFAGATGLVLKGNATISATSGNLMVTQDAANSVGQVYSATPMLVVAGFDTTFQFKVTRAAGGGADGMSFIVHNAVAGTGVTPVGATGSQTGYGGNPGIDNALVVELDMYAMTASPFFDTGPNEVSIHTMGTGPMTAYETNSIGRVLAPPPMFNDQQVHTLRVHYIPGTINVYLDNMTTPVLTTPYDFTTGGNFVTGGAAIGGLNLPNGTAYVGFTGSCGAITQAHEVLNWTFTSGTAPITCETGNIGAGVLPMPAQVLTVNGSSGGAAHVVNTQVFAPLTVAFSPYPTGAVHPFAIWCTFAPPSAQIPLATPFGDLCFLPHFLDPANPYVLTLTDNIGLGIPPLIPSTPGIWSFTMPTGITVPLSFRLQGAIIDALGPQMMNAVTVNVLPLPAPTITSASPIFGNAGATVTINGTNFVNGCVVTFGGVAAAITTQTATQIVTSVPVGVPCPGTIKVTNPDGQFATRPFNQPLVTGTLFGTGSAAGGANFYIYGQGLAAPCTVTIGGNPANVVTNTTSQIICQTPPGLIGVAPVVVTTAQGCTATTTYTYQ
jgi:hypothetical protein